MQIPHCLLPKIPVPDIQERDCGTEYTRQRIYVLCNQKELLEVLELNVQEDHIHLVMWIPPKYSVSSVMGYLKGKLPLRLFQRYENLGKRYWV